MESSPAPAEPSPAPQEKQSDGEKRPPSNGDRKKWEAAELPVLPVAQQTLGETCATTSSEFSLSLTSILHIFAILSAILHKACW